MPITRTPMIDDDGSGTTGTILNNAWKQELYNQIDATTAGQFVWGGYVPTCRTSGGAVTVADGTITGRFLIAGKILFFSFGLTAGPGTTFGPGYFVLGLPTGLPAVASAFQGAFPAQLFDGAQYYQGIGRLNGLTELIVMSGTGLVGPTSPFAWNAGDWLFVDGFYQIA